MSKIKTSYFRAIGRKTVNLYKSKAKKEYWKNKSCKGQLKKLKENYNSSELDKIYEEKPVEQINETGFSGLLDTFVKSLNENLANSASTYVNPIRHLLSEEFGIYNRPVIYAFITKFVPDAIKVGFTRRFHERIEEWKQKYPDLEVIGHWDAFFFMAGMPYFFRDESIHDVIERDRLFKRLADNEFAKDVYVSKEFFQKFNENKEELDGVVLGEIVDEVRNSILSGERKHRYYKYGENGTEETIPEVSTFNPQPKQEEIKEAAKSAFNRGVKKMLLAAVMRFGKTFTSLLIAKEIGAKITLVLTAKADVRGEWRRAIYHKLIIPNTVFVEILGEHKARVSGEYYGEKVWKTEVEFNENFISRLVADGHSVVIFSTLQDLAGTTTEIDSKSVKEIKAKHAQLFNAEIDLLIVDETHYGARGSVYGKSLGYNDEFITGNEDLIANEEREAVNEANLVHELNAKVQLHLSGTPYRIMTTREFEQDGCEVIGVITYVDQLKAMKEWYMAEENQGKEEWKNPLYGLPLINMMGLKLTKNCREVLRAAKRRNPSFTYSISAVFECDKDGNFIHETEIRELFNAIFNGLLDNSYNRNIFNHIVGVLPTVAACHAAAKIIREVAGDENYKIFVAVEGKYGKMDSECKDAKTLDDALEAQEKLGKRTITLTCNRLMTGTTVRCWDTMLYLRGGDSPEFYDQARFRLTSARVLEVYNDKGELSGKDCKKHDVFFIDFQPDRMLSIRAKAIKSETKEGNDLHNRIEEELSSVPYLKLDTVTGKLENYTYVDIMSAYARTDEASFADSVYERRGLYSGLINMPGSDDFISSFSPDGICDNKPMEISPMGEGDETEVGINNPGMKERKPGEKGTGNVNKDKAEEEKLNRIKNGIITILWFVLCTRKVVFKDGIDELFTYLFENDEELERLKSVYGLSLQKIAWLKDNMTREMKDEFRKDCFNTTFILNGDDVTRKDKVKFVNNKCRKISKNGVAVPAWFAKLQLQNVYARLGSNEKIICEVSSICGEYMTAAVDMYGVDVAKNFRILPMNGMMSDVIKRICNIIGVSEDIVLDDLIRDEKTKRVDIKLFIDENKNEKIVKTLKEMKISAAVGNPPYQEGKSKQIYPKFYETCKDVSDTVSLIFPSVWQKPNNRPGIGVKYMYQEETRCDHQIVSIDNYKDVFQNVPGAKEVNILLWEKGYDNGLSGSQKIIQHNDGNTYEEIVDLSCSENVSSDKPKEIIEFANIVSSYPGFKNITSKISKRRPYGMSTNIYKKVANEFSDEQTDDKSLMVFAGDGSKRKILYMGKNSSIIKVGKLAAPIESFKILFPKQWGNMSSKWLGGSFTDIIIAAPGQICTEKYQTAFPCKSIDDARKAGKYMVSRVLRGLVMSEKIRIGTPNDVFKNVPEQDFHEDFWNSDDIDYIDECLFDKYGVPEHIREFIRKNIQGRTIDNIENYHTVK